MRFALSICFGVCLSGAFFGLAAAQTQSQTRTQAQAQTQTPPQHIRKRTRSAAEYPVLPSGLAANIFATNMGDISAMALGGDGAIYTADASRGRIYRLSDRGMDGQRDATRVIATGLSSPSGLAVIGERLFIADAEAIWTSSLSGEGLRRFASLNHVSAQIIPRPLLAASDGSHLILGLSAAAKDGQGRMISVDAHSGRANEIASFAGGINALAWGPNDEVWAATSDLVAPVERGTLSRKRGVSISGGLRVTGLLVPDAACESLSEFRPWQTSIWASLTGASLGPDGAQVKTDPWAMTVAAIPTRFGQASSDGVETFAKGFKDMRGRSAWGRPGAMLLDQRGLFLADSWSGSVWRIAAAPLPVKAAPKKAAKTVDQPVTKPLPKAQLRPSGSSITTGSTIEMGSSILTGSTMSVDDTKKDGDLSDEKPPPKKPAPK